MLTSWAQREGGLSRNHPPPRARVNHPTAALPPARVTMTTGRAALAFPGDAKVGGPQ